jgi:DNA-binding beta-propeller fold protein YncE
MSPRRVAVLVSLALLAMSALVAVPASGAERPRVPSHYLFAVAYSSNVVTVWDGDTSRRVATIPIQRNAGYPVEHSGPCCAYATPDGTKVMVVNGFSPDLETLDVATLKVQSYTHLPGSTWGDRGAQIQRDSKVFWASTLPDQNLFAVDIRSGKLMKSFPGKAQLFANSRDGDVIYRADAAGGLKVLAASDLHEIGQLDGVTGVRISVSPDDRTLYMQSGAFPTPGPKTEYVEVVDVSDRAHPRLVTKMPVPGTSWPAALSPDGRQLWVAGNDQGFVRVFDTRTLKVLKDIDTGAAGGGVAISKEGKAYVAVSPQAFPPVSGASGVLAYFGGVPGAALPFSSDTYRPGVDQPGEVYVYDAHTFARLKAPPMVLPGISFVLTVVDNPPGEGKS